jgi:hypothetical protein
MLSIDMYALTGNDLNEFVCSAIARWAYISIKYRIGNDFDSPLGLTHLMDFIAFIGVLKNFNNKNSK